MLCFGQAPTRFVDWSLLLASVKLFSQEGVKYHGPLQT